MSSSPVHDRFPTLTIEPRGSQRQDQSTAIFAIRAVQTYRRFNLRRRPNMNIPQTPEAIDLPWLNHALQSVCAPSANTIVGFELQGTAGRGFLSAVPRIALAYARPATNLPETVIVKMPSAIPMERAEGDHFDAYRRETAFYRNCANAAPCRPPRCYYTDMDDRAFVIVMEDLRRCRFVDQINGMGVDDALTAVRSLARLHAAYWQADRRSQLPWLPPFSEFARIYPPRIATGKPLTIRNFGHLYDHAVLQAFDVAQRVFPEVVHRLDALPGTLLHIDARADNMAFEPIPGPDAVRMLDWQLTAYGPAAFDLTYFLMHSMETDIRREAHDDILAAYLDELCAGGKVAYPLSTLRDDMGLAGCFMYGFLAWVANFVMPDAKGLEISSRTIPRFCALLNDLDVPARIRTLA